MKLRHTIARYWREAVLVVIIVLPWLALLPLGLLWLWQHAAAIWWLAGAALLGVAAFALRLSIVRSAKAEAAAMAELALPASPEWGLPEKAAWRIVAQTCYDTEPLSFTDPQSVRKLLDGTVNAVANHFNPGLTHAHLQMSLPEALLLAERLAHELRSATLRYVPGVRDIHIGSLFWAKTFYDRYGNAVKGAYPYMDGVRRLARLVMNPKNGVLGEATKLLLGRIGGFLSYRVRAELTNLLIRETGRAAIDLYSGRLRLSSDEVVAALRAENDGATSDLVGPVRILIAGQVNAGKSSLVNAMAQQVQRMTDAVPTRERPAEIILNLAGRPAVVLIDTPGIGNEASASELLSERARKADLILWLVSATQPARAPDVQMLRALREAKDGVPDRRPPPILGVVTHIDELSPASEWAPPYDLKDNNRPKARRICKAIEHISHSLQIGGDCIVPVCVRDLDGSYNVDLLWDMIVSHLDEARIVRLCRLQIEGRGVSTREVLGQMASAGRWLAGAAWRGGSL
jgi:predicted GTPase